MYFVFEPFDWINVRIGSRGEEEGIPMVKRGPWEGVGVLVRVKVWVLVVVWRRVVEELAGRKMLFGKWRVSTRGL